jgi:small basic protein (TIGR04137 family)
MSIDQSLRRKNMLARSRNVLTRAERIKVLKDEERWQDGRTPFGLPKVRVLKIKAKPKAKKEEKPAEGAEAAAAAEGAAPAAPAKGAAPAKAAAPAKGAAPAAEAKAEKKK